MLEHRWKLVAGLKIAVLFLAIVVLGLAVLWQRKNTQIKQFGARSGEILMIPYQQTLYKHFGKAINPQIKLPVKTVRSYQEMEFLIDSGAVVSALPKTLAADLGVNLETLPRITIEGFAGQKTFAYRGEFVVKIGEEAVIIPVVFSENPQTSNILGRIGFFDQFNVTFDARTQKIIISKAGGKL